MLYYTLSVGVTHKSVSVTQAETRAEFAERSVAKLEKTIDDLEGMIFFFFSLELYLCFLLYVIRSFFLDFLY